MTKPENIRTATLEDFQRLKEGKRTWKPENLEWKETEYYLNNPSKNLWVKRMLRPWHTDKLIKRIKEGNVYVSSCESE